MKTLIFDKHIGFLQWVSDKQDEMEALQELDADVGIDPNNEGLSTSDWTFYHVSDEKAEEVEAWHERGSPASEFPL